MKEAKPLLGLCPIGKFVFSNEDALRQKQLVQRTLGEMGVRFVDLDGVLEDGLVKDHSHIDGVVAHFRKAGIDALFLPHCNFGTEDATGMIAKKLGVPALLWGPRDDAPLADGTRLRDSLCGLFASSKVLHTLGIPFSYMENCRVDDPPFRAGLDTFLRAANAARALRDGVRIGHIGQRIDFFWTTIINEGELLQRFNVQVLPLDMMEFVADAKNRAAKGRAGYEREIEELKKSAKVDGYEDDTPFVNVLAVRDQMLALVDDNGLDGLAVQSFMSLVNAMGSYTTYADGCAAERVPFGFESDIHGVISGILLRRASLGTEPTYLTEFTVRHPSDDNAVLLWHAGAPPSLCHPDDAIRLGTHWILPSPLAGMPHFRLKDGPLTVVRFDGDGGDYALAVGEGETVDGPTTLNNYVWMRVDDWPRWERTLIEGPFIHHCAMSYGHVKDALIEACKYVPGLVPVSL